MIAAINHDYLPVSSGKKIGLFSSIFRSYLNICFSLNFFAIVDVFGNVNIILVPPLI
jgi:hypothetical protein